MKKIVLFAVGAALIILLFVNRVVIKDYLTSFTKEQVPPASSYADIVPEASPSNVNTVQPTTTPPTTPPQPPKNTNTVKPPVSNTNTPVSVKSAINLAVPFQSQAPYGDWSEPYQNGCEEASLIMAAHYLAGTSLSKEQMKNEIGTQVDWQIKTWGGHEDIEIAKEQQLAKQFYSYKTEIITGLTEAKIKEQLNLGRPVIIPAAGRELGNPNFTGEGPLYHMLIVKGYTKDGRFITNDPGTRNGADYIYSASVLMSAIRDWDAANHSPDGPKVGLVLYK